VSGTLVGNPGGSYASLTVPYTAGSAQAVHVSWSSSNPAFAQNGIWVVAYQNGNKVAQVHASDESTPQSFSFFYNAPANGPVLIQLGNYTPGSTIDFTLTP
jgi:hypothetical protein